MLLFLALASPSLLLAPALPSASANARPRTTRACAAAPASDKAPLLELVDAFAGDTDGSFFTAHATPEFHYVSASGEAYTAEEYATRATAGNTVITDTSLHQLHKVDVGDTMAFAVLTLATRYTCFMVPNEEVFEATLIFKKEGASNDWRIALAQRSAGRLPNDPTPNFYFPEPE